jgi:hypothetical protein
MSKNLSISDLENSKVFVSEKSSAVKFQHPMEYLERVLTTFGKYTDKITIEGVVGARNKDREAVVEGVEVPSHENVSYSRIGVKARFPQDYTIKLPFDTNFDELQAEVGFVYALDTQNPEIKIFTGKRVTWCMNQCIFGADSIMNVNLLKSNHDKIYDILDEYAEQVRSKNERYVERATRMHEVKLHGSGLFERIGEIAWKTKENNKLGVTLATEMIGMLQDPKSKYALSESGITNDWNIYNTLTEILKKSQVNDEASKVLLLDKIFTYN